jgi:class 3 adenylate cyclase
MREEDLRTSSARLWKLIEQRTKPSADVEAIDAMIWELFGEERAVVFTDLAGFSRNVEAFGIIHFLQVILEHRKLLLPIVDEHAGLLVKTEGDSLLLTFRRVASALRCSIAMQAACAQLNTRRKPEEQILLCVGIGYGQILRIGDEDVWGREVNAASKLGEDIARGNQILITEAAHDALADDQWHWEPIAGVAGSSKNYKLIDRAR